MKSCDMQAPRVVQQQPDPTLPLRVKPQSVHVHRILTQAIQDPAVWADRVHHVQD